MDSVTITLFDRLIDKTFENMDQEARLAFIEKLFAELPSKTQQAVLLKLTQQAINIDAAPGKSKHTCASEYTAETKKIIAIKLTEKGPQAFGPWQACCQAMNEFVESPDAAQVETAAMARMFTGLADETRLKIVKLLSEREYTVDELVKLLGIAQSTTSHHLRVLKDAALVLGDKRGRSVYYSLIHPLEEVSLPE